MNDSFLKTFQTLLCIIIHDGTPSFEILATDYCWRLQKSQKQRKTALPHASNQINSLIKLNYLNYKKIDY